MESPVCNRLARVRFFVDDLVGGSVRDVVLHELRDGDVVGDGDPCFGSVDSGRHVCALNGLDISIRAFQHGEMDNAYSIDNNKSNMLLINLIHPGVRI